VTAELSIHLEDPGSTKRVRREFHKSNICGTSAIVKPLITDNNARRRKNGVMIMKAGVWWVEIRNMIRWVFLHVVPNIRPGLCLENIQENL